MVETNGFYSSYILHAKKNGKVKSINIDAEIKYKIIQQNILTKTGDDVKKFDGSNNTLGTYILKFESQDEMIYYLDRMTDYIAVDLY